MVADGSSYTSQDHIASAVVVVVPCVVASSGVDRTNHAAADLGQLAYRAGPAAAAAATTVHVLG